MNHQDLLMTSSMIIGGICALRTLKFPPKKSPRVPKRLSWLEMPIFIILGGMLCAMVVVGSIMLLIGPYTVFKAVEFDLLDTPDADLARYTVATAALSVTAIVGFLSYKLAISRADFVGNGGRIAIALVALCSFVLNASFFFNLAKDSWLYILGFVVLMTATSWIPAIVNSVRRTKP